MERSAGVLGYLRDDDLKTTYVHLAGGEATVVLADEAPTRPHLRQASHALPRFEVREGGVALQIRGVGEKKVWLGGLAPRHRFRVSAFAREQPPVHLQPVSDEAGRLHFRFKGNGTWTVDVTP